LNPDFPGAVVVAQHVAVNYLAQILALDARVPVIVAGNGMLLRPGTVYVCPAQHHIAIGPDARIALSPRGHVNYFRPNADWLFESAAASFRERSIGVVLAGTMNDGARGATCVRGAGGRIIVQDPETTAYRGMPSATIATGEVDFVASPARIGAMIATLVHGMDLDRCRQRWENPFIHEPLAS
jgi:two-component system chemotaxis response regulator CheB